jgi:hypothetical protein
MPQPKFKFTERDSALLVDLYKHRFLTIEQVQRLHFPSMQTAYRRMRLLKAAGYVSAFTVANIDQSIFMVSPQGIQAVAEALGVDRDQLKWTETKAKPRDYYFMQHFLAINDFRITLRLACEASGIRLVGFIPDYYGEKTDKGLVTKYIRDVICDIANERQEVSHTPDGVFALERNGKQALFFLEIDRGTEVVSDPGKGVLKSVRFYANYLLEGKYQRYAKDFGVPEFKGFRSLYVTTTDIRLANIRQAAGALPVPARAKRFTWITTTDKLTQSTMFTPIWFSIDPTDDSRYQIG